jgi:hypothetical protein
MPLDDLMPRWHFRERHRRTTTAPVPALLAAAELVTWAEVPVLQTLMGVRTAGRLRRTGSARILDGMGTIGFTVLLRTGGDVVVGGIGRPWSPGGSRPPRVAEQADPAAYFAHFTAPGWAKMALDFRATGAELTTETRVWLTDEVSRRRFRRYWLVIRPFSGLIRRQWLAAIDRRASKT